MTESSPKPKVEFMLSRAYGMYRFYPVDEIAQDLCDLMGRKVITKAQIQLLKDKGWDVKVNAQY